MITIALKSSRAGDVAVARFTSSGALDTSFNSTGSQPGTRLIDFGGTDWAEGASLDADGKLVIVGTSHVSSYSIIMARLNADGSLDTSFDGDGEVITNFTGAGCFGSDLVVLPDGKLLVAACCYKNLGGWRYWATFLRFNSDGSVDTSYGFSGANGSGTPGGGATYTDAVNGQSGIQSLTRQADGKLILAGYVYGSPLYQFIVTRHNAAGTYDNSFSDGGKLTVDFGTTYALDIQAATVVDGRIVAVGCKDTGTGSGEDFAVVVLEGGERLEERLWAVHDANWNITAVTDVMGDVNKCMEYDSYGAPTYLAADYQLSTNSYQLAQGFQGLRIDTITGWWDADNRWLIPSLQTWNRMDPNPAGPYVDGMNTYLPMRGNAVNGVDPMGLSDTTYEGPFGPVWVDNGQVHGVVFYYVKRVWGWNWWQLGFGQNILESYEIIYSRPISTNENHSDCDYLIRRLDDPTDNGTLEGDILAVLTELLMKIKISEVQDEYKDFTMNGFLEVAGIAVVGGVVQMQKSGAPGVRNRGNGGAKGGSPRKGRRPPRRYGRAFPWSDRGRPPDG
jgi:uncharacterized delta-60 repeat protein/RHS repeat-associated protein